MRLTVEDRFWSYVDKTGDCWLWTGFVMPDGYGIIRVAGCNWRVHRLSYEWMYGPIPEGLFVCHHCDVPLCVNPLHLFAGTALDNNRDRDRKGRGRWASGDNCGARTHPEQQPRGIRHGMARLSEDDVLTIRAAIAGGTRQCDLADQYGVSRPLITLIKQRKLWGHL